MQWRHINIGLSRDTTQFACDSLKWYWNRIGRQCYPNADSILLLMDCGGGNSASRYIFKHDLMRKASPSTGLRTTVNVIKRIYETGRNATEQMKESIRSTACFETLLPKWNYTVTPQVGQ